MIFESLTLENFGAYGGRHKADLYPEENRPVLLFGGMNGGGKTTMLDAVQLALYGSKARISKRGKLAYRDYLRDCIYRGADPGEGASISLRFSRTMDGQPHSFDLHRSWRVGVKGIEETLDVRRDGLRDELMTDHWDEFIESYLPSSIAHLFFFDGEQIMELAEGGHAADILGTAIHSLLGLDIVDRLEVDLKVFERRKRVENADSEALKELQRLREELKGVDAEQQQLAQERGKLVNQAGRLGKEALELEERFKAEGGELFIQRTALEETLNKVRKEKAALESSLRELSAGAMPFLMIECILNDVEQQAVREVEVRRARALTGALEERDAAVLRALKSEGYDTASLRQLQTFLSKDRKQRSGLSGEALLLEAADDLHVRVAHLRRTVLPEAAERAKELTFALQKINEQIERIEADLERVPTADRIAVIQDGLTRARSAHAAKLTELNALEVRNSEIGRKRAELDALLDRVGHSALDDQVEAEDRDRTLKHSERVRITLAQYRGTMVRKHTAKLEGLMLESFHKLLRKANLVGGLSIDPDTFEPILRGPDGRDLPFNRLSAGERQLLATSLLWGLARASGRPIPTIIDTPLGRLDSAHRKHLVDRYFPNASHQVILLSTDEEIRGGYLESLQPHIARRYKLEHDEKNGRTCIVEGYFE